MGAVAPPRSLGAMSVKGRAKWASRERVTAWLHYAVGVTLGQLREVLGYHLHTHLSAGGLVAAWQPLAEILEQWCEETAEEARRSAVLHADETGGGDISTACEKIASLVRASGVGTWGVPSTSCRAVTDSGTGGGDAYVSLRQTVR